MNKNYLARINLKECSVSFAYDKKFCSKGLCKVSHKDIVIYLKEKEYYNSYFLHLKTGIIISVFNDYIIKIK